jgi:hypothetical protein
MNAEMTVCVLVGDLHQDHITSMTFDQGRDRAAMKVADPQVQASYRQYDLAIGLPAMLGHFPKLNQSPPSQAS